MARLTFEELRGLLKKPKGNDKTFKACCPAHPDSNPSLQVTRGENGALLVYDHGGCSTEAVMAALGRTMADLMPAQDHEGREIVAIHLYADESGKLLFEKVKYHPRSPEDLRFQMRRPDGRGGWIYKLDDTRRVLYRLRELLKGLDAGEVIYISEGEKDVDRLCSMDLTATCNFDGGGKWRKEYSDILQRAKRIVIFQDNDATGKKHTAKIKADFPNAVVVTFDELPDGADVSDWLNDGHTKEQLLERVEAAANASRKLHFRSLGDLLRQPRKPTDWLVDGLLPKAGVSLVYAKPKVGKSTLARILALAVAHGDRFLDRAVTAGAVLYLALEEIEEEVTAHFRDQGATGTEPIKVFAAMAPGDCLPELRAVVEQEHPALVIVDPLFRFTRIKDGNDYAMATAALEPLVDLARKTGTHVMLVHHAKKGDGGTDGDGILGSTALLGSVDTAICLRKAPDGVRLVSTIQRYGASMEEEAVLVFDADSRTVTLGGTRADLDNTQMRGELLAFLQEQDDPVTEAAIGAAVEGRKQVKVKALRDLWRSGAVTREGKGGRGGAYLYSVCGSVVPGVSKEPGNHKRIPFLNPCHETGQASLPRDGFSDSGSQFPTTEENNDE